MKKFFNISNTELTVMEKLWEQEGSIRQSQLLPLFEADGKTWKRQTINTFLIRLEAKGLVERKSKMVKTVYSREKYNYMQMKAAIDYLYGGRLSNFVTAFVQNDTMTEKDMKELICILENR